MLGLRGEEDTPAPWDKTLSDISPLIREIIIAWDPIPLGGHSGYCSIAKTLGFTQKNGWRTVGDMLLMGISGALDK